MKTLPDYLAGNLAIISVGINPSPSAVRCGYPFASTRNRFWRALNQSTLVSQNREPSIEAMYELLEVDRIGFTDIVKRSTKSANELNARDFRDGANLLLDKLQYYRPRIVWFQGMLAAKSFFKHVKVQAVQRVCWGQLESVGNEFEYFVSPNPSSANAVYKLEDLVEYFNRLARLKCAVCG